MWREEWLNVQGGEAGEDQACMGWRGGCMQSRVSQPRQVVMGYEHPRHCQQLVSLTAALQAYPVWVPYGILTSGIFAAPELRAS